MTMSMEVSPRRSASPQHPLTWLTFIWAWMTFLLALWLSWHLLAKVDFLYPIWYKTIGIHEHIQHYAPQNRYKPDFEHTTQAERMFLFHGIVHGIHHQGNGLEDLRYHPFSNTSSDDSSDVSSNTGTPLLRPQEVGHLKDVAHLIDQINQAALKLFFFWLVLTAWRITKRQTHSFRQVWFLLEILLIPLAIALFVIGPETVFNQLHIWAFPTDNPWFFYYQDSLMTTLMKAPDLFAYIPALLVLIGGALFSVFNTLINRFIRRLPE